MLRTSPQAEVNFQETYFVTGKKTIWSNLESGNCIQHFLAMLKKSAEKKLIEFAKYDMTK